MYDIPLEQQIQRQLLYDREFAPLLVDWDQVPRSNDGSIKDIQDGTVAQRHPFLGRPKANEGAPNRLAFAVYADDVEVVNPIGYARTKHKVTLYYATILNVPWHLRSKLDHMYLVAVVLTKVQASVSPQRVVQGNTDDAKQGCCMCSNHLNSTSTLHVCLT